MSTDIAVSEREIAVLRQAIPKASEARLVGDVRALQNLGLGEGSALVAAADLVGTYHLRVDTLDRVYRRLNSFAGTVLCCSWLTQLREWGIRASYDQVLDLMSALGVYCPPDTSREPTEAGLAGHYLGEQYGAYLDWVIEIAGRLQAERWCNHPIKVLLSLADRRYGGSLVGVYQRCANDPEALVTLTKNAYRDLGGFYREDMQTLDLDDEADRPDPREDDD